jgi:hypothetical protein
MVNLRAVLQQDVVTGDAMKISAGAQEASETDPLAGRMGDNMDAIEGRQYHLQILEILEGKGLNAARQEQVRARGRAAAEARVPAAVIGSGDLGRQVRRRIKSSTRNIARGGRSKPGQASRILFPRETRFLAVRAATFMRAIRRLASDRASK